jgi:hypothetical protein
MVSKVLTDRRAFDAEITALRPRPGASPADCAKIEDRATCGRGNTGAARPGGPKAAANGETSEMPELFVGKVADIAEGDRRIVTYEGLEIGVLHWRGRFYAYENLCLHQGGPCCEGVIRHKVEDVLGP